VLKDVGSKKRDVEEVFIVVAVWRKMHNGEDAVE
jgi:hypothetical protein